MYPEEISIMSRRILIISQYYFPENFRINDIAIGLSEEFEVEVLTAIPNYPYGKKFSGYRNRYSSKKESGVLIHRQFSRALSTVSDTAKKAKEIAVNLEK